MLQGQGEVDGVPSGPSREGLQQGTGHQCLQDQTLAAVRVRVGAGCAVQGLAVVVVGYVHLQYRVKYLWYQGGLTKR